MKILDYKGYEIHYDTFTRDFIGGDKRCPTQAEAEAYIDKLVRTAKEDFARIPAILSSSSWSGGYKTGEITSFVDNEYAWFVSSGKRSKENIKYLFADTPDNQTKVQRYNELNKQVQVLQKERDGIKLSDPIQPPKSTGNTGTI